MEVNRACEEERMRKTRNVGARREEGLREEEGEN